MRACTEQFLPDPRLQYANCLNCAQIREEMFDMFANIVYDLISQSAMLAQIRRLCHAHSYARFR